MSDCDPWLPLRGRPTPDAVSLVCLPYAGGSAAVFREWSAELPPSIEPLAVEFPGRGARIGERPFRRVRDLAAAAAEALFSQWRRPYAMFGHSLGALVAFEMLRILERAGTPPTHLFVSACRAPHLSPTADPIHRLERSALRERLRAWGGIPEPALDPDVFAIFEPGLRADLEAAETYQCTSVEDRQVPIAGFAGLDDPLAPLHAVAQWSQHTAAEFTMRALPGNHFFLRESRTLLLDTIVSALAPEDAPQRKRTL
jgi:surfactin synthase thioesterase subunit